MQAPLCCGSRSGWCAGAGDLGAAPLHSTDLALFRWNGKGFDNLIAGMWESPGEGSVFRVPETERSEVDIDQTKADPPYSLLFSMELMPSKNIKAGVTHVVPTADGGRDESFGEAELRFAPDLRSLTLVRWLTRWRKTEPFASRVSQLLCRDLRANLCLEMRVGWGCQP